MTNGIGNLSVQSIELESLEKCEPKGAPILNGSLAVVRNVKVRLDVRVGDALLPVGELLDLKPGSVVQLTQSVTAPVELLLEGRVIALGELSVVGDNFAVRVRELCE